MPVLGEIAARASGHMPATWEALSKRQQFGEEGLQRRVDTVKEILFGEVAPYDQELALYGPLGVEYAGICVALDLVSAGYDHWMAAATSWGASGRNENKTFIDRAQALLKLRDEVLVPAEERLYPRVADLLVGVLVPKRQGVMTAQQPRAADHVTPDPLTFEPPYERPRTIA